MSTSMRIEDKSHFGRRAMKRIFDIAFSTSALLLGAPLFLCLLCLVKLTSKGPALHIGWRMGQNGKLIRVRKFRTMCVDAEERLEAILTSDPQMKTQWETFHKLKDDPRLTPIGSFLRKTSLDEIPQFWDVLVGSMSIVGPRPITIETPETADVEIRERYGEKTDKILSAKPGITCIWQVRGRNNLTFAERTAMEEEYVDTQSFFLDLSIIAKTIKVLINPKGAY